MNKFIVHEIKIEVDQFVWTLAYCETQIYKASPSCRSTYCRWEEQLVFNESPEHFTSDEPQVLMFFQLMDFPPSAGNSPGIPESTSRDWVTFAWAFLKVKGTNNHVNIGEQLRLQMWRPRRSSKVGLKDLHSWWKSGSRTKYPSTLHVTLQEVVIPLNPQPTLRSADLSVIMCIWLNMDTVNIGFLLCYTIGYYIMHIT